MLKKLDLTGQKYGRLLALRESAIGHPMWEFQCDCGKIHTTSKHSVRAGKTTSCGCASLQKVLARNKARIKFGGILETPTGRSWKSMMSRCYNKNVKEYVWYGAIGRCVCEFIRATPENLVLLIGHRPPEKTIDRKDNSLNYSCGACAECLSKGWPLNVRWATKTEQARNTSQNSIHTINGEQKCATEWQESCGVKSGTFWSRIAAGKTGGDLISTTRLPRTQVAK